jgi:copper transport protein
VSAEVKHKLRKVGSDAGAVIRLVAAIAVLLWACCLANEASAHASLVSTEPADGSMMASAPETVSLRFNEPVTPASIRLIDGAGKARDDITVSARGDTIEINLPHDLPRGAQILSYRVFSADGHPVGGSFVFSLGMSENKVIVPADRTLALDGLIWLARLGIYAGLFAGIGGAFFDAWISRTSSAQQVVVAALSIGCASAVAAWGFQGLDLLGRAPADILTFPPWRAAAGTSLAPSLLIAIVAMTLAGTALLKVSGRTKRLLSAAAILGVGVALAASGHASTAPPQWLTRPMVFLHGVAVAFWIGGLAPLAALAMRPAASLLVIVNRFSRVAVPVVAGLALTGLALAAVQLVSIRALVTTNYGVILSIKLVLVTGLLGLAALNRFRLTPQLAVEPLNTRALVRSIVLEGVVAAGILSVVAGWRFTPPPRALATAAVKPLAIHIHTDEAMFQVLISPGTVGKDSFVLQLMEGDASPLVAKEATLILSLPERGIEPLQRTATLGADGYWHVRDTPIPYPGRWHMRIEALVTDFRKVTLEDDFDVASP